VKELSKLSISFVVRDNKSKNCPNIVHNNREYIPENADPERQKDNIIFKKCDVLTAYNELFGESLEEYSS
jgi:hypothetical protein